LNETKGLLLPRLGHWEMIRDANPLVFVIHEPLMLTRVKTVIE
jgi:hypothetical protein